MLNDISPFLCQLDRFTSLDSQISSINSRLERLERGISQLNDPTLGSFQNPASSCKFIPQGSPSGHYWIQNAGTGCAKLEYCDMTRRCCDSTGGWMRVANLDMTDSNQQCPSGFRLITSPRRTCGTPGRRCMSTTFNLNGVEYSRVCGKIVGYQFGSPDAFSPYYHNIHRTIDDSYVDGVSLTHGQGPRKHIWTFAAAVEEREAANDHDQCPCMYTYGYRGLVPPFIGQDYFCDTGSRYRWQAIFYHADPLWDGSGCGSTSSCCGFNNPPWFCKQLPQPTTDDIELRLCIDESTSNEEVALEAVEIYVQ